MSIADSDDEDLMGVEIPQLGQAPSSLSPQRRDPRAVHRAAHRHIVYQEVSSTTTTASLQCSTPDASRQELLEELKLQCPALPAGTIR